MRLGFDFGTTNSSIAHYDGRALTSIRLDPEGDNPYVLPSLVYIDRELRALLGTAAASEYLRRETGRPVAWEKRPVGEVEVIVGGSGGPIRYVQQMSVVVDTAANGRLLQSIKTALRDPAYEGTEIFDRFYTLDELIAMVLRELRERAEQHFGEPCRSVVLGRPVRFSDDQAVTERAEEILFKAGRLAGFTDIAFQLEPIGAAYLHHATTTERQTALVFDFGGGTLDLTLAELGGGEEPHVLA
ncbi:MAG: Hsp70 family protein, partial [Anaerolineales bacterium]|nr:Hsp70 family protein [Anaerolineales bacterium]